MIKEKLTMENIRSDLRATIKGYYITIVLFTLLLLIFLGGSILFLKHAYFSYHTIIFCLGVIIHFVVIVVLIKDLILLYKNFNNKKCIVKDKLISAEITGEFRRRRYVDRYRLNFNCYGKYMIPQYNNYPWSSLYCMRDEGVYNYSTFNDEFILVLSKPYTGHIILAYNTKLFELE